ncbi:hypothetical protein M514_02466 [Trichuris suis]|uniref:Nicotinamide phosphoribosyltransferase n=1 Tax=Trichuris suis TaxID=68888 RepID=A0A085NF83_9BILA|nr:hypothetical protein M514_02466 [Trichuris suis]KHJ44558.1 nicotinate phosphoribosyltransferase, (NAPRTase) family [Trichuris suis]
MMLPLHFHDRHFRFPQSAAIGDAAHLVNFRGTDTVAGIRLCQKYYACPMAGYSVPAAEHSTITSWDKDHEADAYRNILERYPVGTVSVVSDSYDLYDSVERIWGGELKQLVHKRADRGCVVIRPDSGDPIEVTVKVLELLSKHYPCLVNSKGYKVLPSYLRVIQGDGVSYDTMRAVLKAMKDRGWSAENVSFGTGGALLQRVHRDTLKCAFKCSAVVVDGKMRSVYKEPITDKEKTSKKGRLSLHVVNGIYKTMQGGIGDPKSDLLVTVFENGHLLKEYSLDDIRMNATV